MDQWGFQGITILQEILGRLFSRDLLRDLANLNGVPLIQGSLYTWGNNNREPLRDLGKSQWSSFTWGVSEGIIVRFGKISMEFLHLGGQQGNHCEIWENLNGVPSFGGFTRVSNSCLKGADDECSHGPMRTTVCCINWGNLTHGEQWTNGSLQSRFGKIWRKVVYSYCPKETMIKFAQSWFGV